jgi:hypothetical protein
MLLKSNFKDARGIRSLYRWDNSFEVETKTTNSAQIQEDKELLNLRVLHSLLPKDTVSDMRVNFWRTENIKDKLIINLIYGR